MTDQVVDGVMVSADNVVQCGQATVQWIGTTVCPPSSCFRLRLRVIITKHLPNWLYPTLDPPLSHHLVTYHILSSYPFIRSLQIFPINLFRSRT